MPAYYIVSEWVQTEGEDGPKNTPRLFLEHPTPPGTQWTDITNQVGPEIAHGHLCVCACQRVTPAGIVHENLPQNLVNALQGTYRLIRVDGRPSPVELDELKANGTMRGAVEAAEARHGANMTNEQLKNALIDQFRKQGKK